MPETVFPVPLSGRDLAAFRRRVRSWYRKHGRALPWRNEPDAYRVWISEIMLQQTTVAAVKPYFERFLARFPTVFDLAAANEDDVLRLWEGLGYYSRARNIHKTAKSIAGDFDGVFPESTDQLQQLPGIGRYTAGAIASFAFDRPAGIVEANTLRLYARLLGYEDDPRSTVGQRVLWAFAEHIVAKRSPGEFNQALMDLGATVCLPNHPACESCPIQTHCLAFANDRVADIPRPKQRPEMTELREAAIVVRKNNRVLLRRCEPGERWAGLWDFPRYDVTHIEPGSVSPRQLESILEKLLGEQTGIQARLSSQIKELRHTVTRYRITLTCHTADFESGMLKRNGNTRWVRVDDLDGYALSTTGRKIAKTIAR